MELFSFIKNNNVLYTICAASLSTQVVGVADTLVNNVIVPVMDMNVIKEEDKTEHMTVRLGNLTINHGKIIIMILRIIIIVFILYIIYKLVYGNSSELS